MFINALVVSLVAASVTYVSVKFLLTPSPCKLSSGKCNLKDMNNDGYPSTLVQPDESAETYCIDFSPYQFEVIRGAKNKLMISFQGGGAGWDKLTLETLPKFSPEFCQRNIKKQDQYGIYDRSNSYNAFKDYTIVNVLYCSGDLHAGEATRKFKGGWGNTVKVNQTGYKNTMATLDWINSQIGDYLNSDLDSLVISGQSAGAIGAQLWSHYIIEKFNAKKKVVIIDSYLGVFPVEAGPIIDSFNICDKATILPPGVDKTTCQKSQEKLLPTIAKASMVAHPTVPFAFIQSKEDIFQIGFYELIIFDSKLSKDQVEASAAKLLGWFPIDTCLGNLFQKKAFEDFLKCLTGGFSLQFQKLEKGILEVYSKLEVGNFRAYLVDGLVHTFTNKVYYYTTDPSSKTFTSPGVCINLSTWLNDLINNQRPDDSMCIADTANEIFCKKSVDPVFPSCNNQMTQIGNSGTSSTSV